MRRGFHISINLAVIRAGAFVVVFNALKASYLLGEENS